MRKVFVGFFVVGLLFMIVLSTGLAAPKTVNLKFWRAGVEGNEHDYWVKAVERFNKSQKAIQIEYSDGSWNDMQTKLNIAFASGSAPDIIGHAINSIADRVSKGQYQAVDDLFNKWEGRNDVIDFYKKAPIYNGKMYGIGWKVGAYLWAYRKDYFKEVGLDPEKPPQNWDDLLKCAEKLTIREGGKESLVKRAGLSLPIGDDRLFVVLLNQAGGRIENQKGEPAWNSPEGVQVLKFVNEVGKKNITIPITQANNDVQDQFATGKSAMGMVSLQWIQNMFEQDPSMKEKVGFMMIGNKKKAAWAGCEILFISSTTKYRKEAWKFVESVMTKQEVWNRYEGAGISVVRKSLMDKFIASNPLINKGLMMTVENGVQHAKVPWSSLFARNYAQRMMEEAQLTDKPQDQILKSYYDKMLQEIKK